MIKKASHDAMGSAEEAEKNVSWMERLNQADNAADNGNNVSGGASSPINNEKTIEEIPEPYKIIPNPDADEIDLSALRGTRAPPNNANTKERNRLHHNKKEGGEDLDALAELVPELKTRTSINPFEESLGMTVGGEGAYNTGDNDVNNNTGHNADFGGGSGVGRGDGGRVAEIIESNNNSNVVDNLQQVSKSVEAYPTAAMEAVEVIDSPSKNTIDTDNHDDNNAAVALCDVDEDVKVVAAGGAVKDLRIGGPKINTDEEEDGALSESVAVNDEDDVGKLGGEQNLGGFDDVDSEANAIESDSCGDLGDRFGRETKARGGDNAASRGYPQMSSDAASLSTATQTHEVRMPMYLPTFKPATGCTNASDFIVRCFVARLRSGITVVKHGRSRWCKSRLRILHIHSDGRSLSWKPAVGEPATNKKPPKLDLSTCMEVRHAWSPDPLNPMFTGTPILRQKCEAANAHKSFALIFPKRTVDITAVTADQCKVLMEGFSALCFRLQVANLAGKGSKKERIGSSGDEEEAETTASVTLTNNSTQLSPSGSGAAGRKRR